MIGKTEGLSWLGSVAGWLDGRMFDEWLLHNPPLLCNNFENMAIVHKTTTSYLLSWLWNTKTILIRFLLFSLSVVCLSDRNKCTKTTTTAAADVIIIIRVCLLPALDYGFVWFFKFQIYAEGNKGSWEKRELIFRLAILRIRDADV